MIPEKISHYRIIKKLGAGGMGEVFLAQDTKLRRKVAIKRLPARSLEDSVARRRLVAEARAAARLDHPNICPIFEVDEEGGQTFIVMQYVEGRTLSNVIRTSGVEVPEALDIAAQVAEALAEAHSRGVVHRDIKPQNLIITPKQRVKVLDFGLAKATRDTLVFDSRTETTSLISQPGTAVGTAPYMSPEQVKGAEVDARSDLFSLGVVLYESVTGQPPFGGANVIDICASVLRVDPPPPSELNQRVPASVDHLILKSLAKNPGDRYQSAGEMLADLRKVQAECQPAQFSTTAALSPSAQFATTAAPSLPQESPAGEAIAPPFWRRGISMVAALLVVLAGVVAVLVAIVGRGVTHTPPAEALRLYDTGTAALREGAYYQASKALARAVELDGNFVLARARLAEAYAEVEQMDKSKDELLRAIPRRSELQRKDALYLDAIVNTVNRDLDRAIETYHQLADLAADSEKASVYVDLGRAYEKVDNPARAIEYYVEATKRDTQSAVAYLRLAVLYGRMSDLNNATDAFRTAESVYDASSNEEGVTEVFYQRGTMLNTMDRLAEARAQFEKALERALITRNRYQEIRTRIQLSIIYNYRDAEKVRAQEYATKAIELARADNIQRLATDGLIDLGGALMSRGDHEAAEKYFDQALDFAQKDKMHRAEARARLALGSLNVQRDNPDRAIEYCRPALAFYEPGGYKKETCIALSLLGRADRQKGDYEGALKSFEQQLQVANDLRDQALKATALNDMGVLLSEQERYPEALARLDESYKINDSLRLTYNAGYDLMIRGGLLWQMGRYGEAESALDRALAIASEPKAGYQHLKAWVTVSRGQMALSRRRFQEAAEKAQQATVAGSSYPDIAIQAGCVLGLAKALSGAPEPGRQICEKAVLLARDRNNARELSTARLALAEVMLNSNDPQNALTAALQAEAVFAQSRWLESQWQALLIAARACKLMGRSEEKASYASRASSTLALLLQEWGIETSDGYTRRPDIEFRRRQLNGITGQAK